MKRKLFTFALAALTVGLLGSCSKINERIDNLEKRIDGIESNQIASIKSQVDAINTSIADLGTIRQNVQTLMNTAPSKEDIEELRKADEALGRRIDELKSYTDGELTKYATTEWVMATFATLEQHQWTCDTIAKIDARIGALDAKLSQSISGLESSLKQWVNEQLDAYYTAAQMDAKLDVMWNDINNAKAQGKTATDKADSLATELTALKTAVDTAKTAIRTEYKNAIDEAINKLDGEIRGALLDSIAAVNGRIEALDTRVTTLEGKVLALEGKVDKLLAMIQSVSITPAYSDGSVEAVDGILTLKCIVSPAEAISGMESLKDSLLIYADSVKVKTKATTPAYMTIEVSEASVLDAAQGAITLTADISEYLPKGEDKALTVAVNIKNGISDFTTEFVPVTPIVEYVEIKAKYDGSTVSTLRWYKQNLAITDSGKKAWKGDSGSAVKVPGTGEDVVVGDYFQWGTFTGFYGNGAGTDKGLLPYTSFTSTGCGDGFDAFTFKDGKQFNQTNAPYWSGSAYTKYNATDKKKELDASDDVASVILGGTWRMPTTKEFQALKEVTYWAWDATDKGYYVYTPNPASDAGKVNDGTGTYNKADALLFFPTAGNGYENTYYDVESIADYWYGSLNSESIGSACHLFFNSSGGFNADSRDSDRYRGYSVRPVQDPAATYVAVTNVSLDVTAKEIEEGGNVQLIVTVAPASATQNGVYWTSSAPTVATVDATGKVTAVAAGTATITATTVDGTKTATCTVTVTKSPLPAGALKGEFSVSANKKVHFSKGNLWADGSNALHFEANQNSSASSWDASHVSHFTWSSTVEAAVGNNSSGDYLFCDESHKVSVDGGEAIYYALSRDEWTYLFNNHSNKWASVNGMEGYVIAPDGFEGELANSYANDAELVTAGNLVFLPAANFRMNSSFPPENFGDGGFYWSSTAFTEALLSPEAYYLRFDVDGVYPDDCSTTRSTGNSVRLVTDASVTPAPTPTTGTAKRTGDIDVKWIQLWEDGPKFAEYNVGVTDGKAESYGGYYNWGMSDVHTSLNSDNYKSGESPLTGESDTATKLWGSNWRMPTKDELQGLLDNCNVEWTTVGGVNGCKFTGKGDYASNSVFLPAAGDCSCGDVYDQGDRGYYWSSTPYGSDEAYNLHFVPNGQDVSDYGRDLGVSVRAVLAE